MRGYKSKLISILMESPLYLTLSVKERHSLVARLKESYPFLSECDDDETEVGYEASWSEVIRNHS